MRKMMKIAALFLVVITTTNAIAQELPKPSPAAKVEQRIGLTDVTIKYSRPSVKGRKIWGELEAYDVVWRAGANANTLITFSDDVKVDGKELKKGTYSLFITPSKGDWTVLFNTDVEGWGTGNYDKVNDALSLTVKAGACELKESLSFSIENLTETTGSLVFSWEKIALEMVIEVDVDAKAWENIEGAVAKVDDESKAEVFRNAAKYSASSKKRLAEGLKWINESIAIKDSWYSYWVKADVQHAAGDNAGAIVSAKKAIEIGEASAKEKGKPFSYKKRLEQAILDFK
jgi:hypothetical protein